MIGHYHTLRIFIKLVRDHEILNIEKPLNASSATPRVHVGDIQVDARETVLRTFVLEEAQYLAMRVVKLETVHSKLGIR